MTYWTFNLSHYRYPPVHAPRVRRVFFPFPFPFRFPLTRSRASPPLRFFRARAQASAGKPSRAPNAPSGNKKPSPRSPSTARSTPTGASSPSKSPPASGNPRARGRARAGSRTGAAGIMTEAKAAARTSQQLREGSLRKAPHKKRPRTPHPRQTCTSSQAPKYYWMLLQAISLRRRSSLHLSLRRLRPPTNTTVVKLFQYPRRASTLPLRHHLMRRLAECARGRWRRLHAHGQPLHVAGVGGASI